MSYEDIQWIKLTNFSLELYDLRYIYGEKYRMNCRYFNLLQVVRKKEIFFFLKINKIESVVRTLKNCSRDRIQNKLED